MKKLFGMLTAGILLAMTTTVTAFAGEWQQNNNGWQWINDNGSIAMNGWNWIDGNQDGVAECYYFDEAGYMWTNDSLTPDGYQVDENGAWIVDGVLQTKELFSADEQIADDSHIIGNYYYHDVWLDTYHDWSTLHCEKNSDGTYHIYTVYKDDGTIGLDAVCYAKKVEENMAGTAFYPLDTDNEMFRYVDQIQEFAYWGPWEVEYYGKTLPQ